MIDIGPFPVSWLRSVDNYIQIYPWYPLSSSLINKGKEWIPELRLNATVGFVMRSISHQSTSADRSPTWMKLKTERK